MSKIYWNNTRIFGAFAELEEQFARFLQDKRMCFPGVSEEAARKRLVQKFFERCYFPYARICARRHAAGSYPLPPDASLELEGIRFDQKSGKLSVSPGLVFLCILKFMNDWLRLSLYICKSLRLSASSNLRQSVLVWGIGAESIFSQNSDDAFAAYLRSGPVLPLSTGYRIVQYGKKLISGNDDSLVYHPRPVEGMLELQSLSIAKFSRLMAAHFQMMVRFVYACFRQPFLCLLHVDAAYAGIIGKMDQWGILESVVFTNAIFTQYTWMRSDTRSFSVHQVYYSQNIKPLVYKADPYWADYPGYKHLHADEVWLWNEDIAHYLRRLGFEGITHITAPIAWRLPHEVNPDSTSRNIVIFDISPIDDKAALNFGIINNYFSEQNLRQFIGDILDVCEEVNNEYGMELRLIIKHKRPTAKIHTSSYQDYIEALVNTGKIAAVAAHDADIFSLIGEHPLTISIPFTSTVYISEWMKKPAVIYDFSGQLEDNYIHSADTSFVNSKAALREKFSEVFNSAHHQNRVIS